ncbi:MAG: ABC transporter ATP-binding protein [Myxococcota bacterium]|nr:ABC transporter ATP-binding protein [Myxococcota bacterium]
MSQPTHTHRDERLSDLTDAQLIVRLWLYMKPHRSLLFTALLLYIPIVGAMMLEPWLIGEAIDEYLKGAGSSAERLAGVTHYGLIGVAAALGGAAAMGLQQLCLQRLGLNTLRDLRRTTFDKAMRLDLKIYDHEPVGRVMARMTNDIDSLTEVFAFGAVGMVADLILLAAVTIWLFVLDVKLALFAMLVVPPLLVIMRVFQRYAHNTYGSLRRRSSALNAYLQETLNGLSTVQLFAAEDYLESRYDAQNQGYRDAAFDTIRYDVTLFAVIESIGTVSTALIIWYGAGALDQGLVTLGLLIAFSEYMRRFFTPLRDLGSKYAMLQAGFASADRVFGLLDTPIELGDNESPVVLDQPIESMRLEGVHFHYLPDEPVLSDVDFTLRQGERVAIVGRTGSGKSTLLALLLRFRSPQSGRVTVNGTDLAQLEASSLRKRLGVVQQDSFLFAGSLEQNITMDALDVDAERLALAFQASHLDQVKERLAARRDADQADGDAPEILEGGSNLSAGERQLVAMARALYRNPEVLLLDEATANIDQETERLLTRTTEAVLEGRTALVIAHRLSTVEKSDRIIVLDQGRVLESGSPAELLAQGGAYAELVAHHRALTTPS